MPPVLWGIRRLFAFRSSNSRQAFAAVSLAAFFCRARCRMESPAKSATEHQMITKPMKSGSENGSLNQKVAIRKTIEGLVYWMMPTTE